ncbi:MAG: hypothetical protein GX657_16850 [Chloroflexi bacterium]|jgi:anti-sigma factor RsiW|nr:hypothetical protein [Chloroflexota bacterium]
MPRLLGLRNRTEHRFARARLSTYLDDRLPRGERERLSRHLAGCAACQEDLATLRATVAALRQMPRLAVPRSFVLSAEARAEQARQRRWNNAFGTLRTATLVAASLLMVLIAGDALLGTAMAGVPVPIVAPEAAPAAAPEAAGPGEQTALPAAPPMMMAAAAPEATEPVAPDEARAGPAGAPAEAPDEAPAEDLPARSAPEPTAAAELGVAPTAPSAAEPPAPSVSEPLPSAPPGMDGGGEGLLAAPPTSGATTSVTVPGAVVESPSGLQDPGQLTPTPAPAPTAQPTPGPTAAAEAAPAALATEPTSGPDAASGPAGAENAYGSAAPAVAAAAPLPERDGQGQAPASTGSAAPAASASESGASAERVYGLAAEEALDLWQAMRLGGALTFGVLLVLLSGTVWTGHQRRL